MEHNGDSRSGSDGGVWSHARYLLQQALPSVSSPAEVQGFNGKTQRSVITEMQLVGTNQAV